MSGVELGWGQGLETGPGNRGPDREAGWSVYKESTSWDGLKTHARNERSG